MFALVNAPAPFEVAPAERKPSRKRLRRERQRALVDIDPDGDILPLEMTGSRYSQYRENLWHRDPHCIFCGRQLKLKDSTLDHAFPVSKGGLNCPWNLWLCCSLCNHSKGDRSAIDWLNDLLNACIMMGLISEDDDDIVEFDNQFNGDEIGGVA